MVKKGIKWLQVHRREAERSRNREMPCRGKKEAPILDKTACKPFCWSFRRKGWQRTKTPKHIWVCFDNIQHRVHISIIWEIPESVGGVSRPWRNVILRCSTFLSHCCFHTLSANPVPKYFPYFDWWADRLSPLIIILRCHSLLWIS